MQGEVFYCMICSRVCTLVLFIIKVIMLQPQLGYMYMYMYMYVTFVQCAHNVLPVPSIHHINYEMRN